MIQLKCTETYMHMISECINALDAWEKLRIHFKEAEPECQGELIDEQTIRVSPAQRITRCWFRKDIKRNRTKNDVPTLSK